MTPGETAAAIAALAVGIYLILASAGLVQIAINQLIGLAVGAFGVAYIAAGRTRESAFWGGVLAILGVATAAGWGASPLFVVGVVLVFISLFALLASRR
ncbi:hypothetical protein [Pyrobaculum aerophilum]|uniref:Uncharacterized protein n=1 Tax=Pyrobaculum aerophilum TaxID=13773 RepID=A0A371R2A8_9CREN|nr:hypothetical protein [Pyrobaculum aerophilum]RFA95469.1 hypothetical protein CGL51_07650 [Pyrobaculum aerophilum]RFA97658.1 hypothetical protein CGL52_08660 [Pyrobaculum aerophilum]